MENRIRIGVRYCGGCNPRYDRVVLVKKLESLLPEATFVSAREADYLAVVVVCGCTARCADTGDLTVEEGRRIYIKAPEDLEPARKRLEQILCRKETCIRN